MTKNFLQKRAKHFAHSEHFLTQNRLYSWILRIGGAFIPVNFRCYYYSLVKRLWVFYIENIFQSSFKWCKKNILLLLKVRKSSHMAPAGAYSRRTNRMQFILHCKVFTMLFQYLLTLVVTLITISIILKFVKSWV